MEISKKMDNAIIMKIAKKKLVSVMFQYRSTAAVSVATRGEATKRIHILIIGAFRYVAASASASTSSDAETR